MSDARGEIEDLLYRYAERVDAGDFEGIGRMLSHAVVLGADGAPLARGASAVTRLYEATTRRHVETGTPRTQHVVSNPIVELDGAAATCRSRYTVLQQTGALPLQPIVAGRYESRFERVDGRWRFTSHRFFVDLVGDVSQHLLIELFEAGAGSARGG